MSGARLSSWEVYSFFINYVFGAGVLALPYTFHHNGVLICFFFLLISVALAWSLQTQLLAISDQLTLEERSLEPLLRTGDRKVQYQWDMPAIIRYCLGSQHWGFFFPFFALANIASLATYNNIVGTAIGALLMEECNYSGEVEDQCLWRYRVGVLMFASIAVVLTVMDYKKQAVLQSVMTLLRVVLVLTIVFLIIRTGSFGNYSPSRLILVHSCSVGEAFALILFACLYHGATPSIIAVAKADTHSQQQIARFIALSTFFSYLFIGVPAALLLPAVPENISLLYASVSQKSFWLNVSTSLLLLIPMLQICANASMYGQTLSGAVTSWLYGSDHHSVRHSHPLCYLAIRLAVLLPGVGLAWHIPRLVRK